MIDWDNAPKGATHWNGKGGAEWFRLYDGKWFYYSHVMSNWIGSVNRSAWYETLTPRPTAPTPHTMTPTHIEISTGKEWEMVYQSSESCMLTDRNGSAYSLVARDLSQYFTPMGGDTREMTERERFDAVMTRSDWSGFDKGQRGVLWEMWKEALGM